MKLADWFKQPNPDGSKRRKGVFAAEIGVTASMITEYCEGRMWPGREKMEAIVKATGGQVTANDFLQTEVVS